MGWGGAMGKEIWEGVMDGAGLRIVGGAVDSGRG